MFSLNESVRWEQRRQQWDLMAGAAILLGHVPSLATHLLCNWVQSHLKTLCASISLPVRGTSALPSRGMERLAAEWLSTEEEGVGSTRTPLLAEAWTGLFSKTIPSPTGIVKSRCPSVGCLGKDWKVDSARCLSSVTVEM